jgi:5-methyltetrahydrofolate--homocysteine methyltransferase
LKNSDFNVIEAVANLKENEVLAWVQKELESETQPHEIINRVSEGLELLGNRFSAGDCFIPELIRGGNLFQKALEIVQPTIEASKTKIEKVGKFLIGTVKGDLHDLGKNLISVTFITAGFEVIDLGKDVSTEKFVEETKRLNPDLLGLSALLTTTTEKQQEVIEALKSKNLRSKVKIIVGGAPVNQKWADKIGADAYGADAIDGLRKAKALLGIS